jgi:hypothetical protein
MPLIRPAGLWTRSMALFLPVAPPPIRWAVLLIRPAGPPLR